jgi:hypothetical protein
MLQLERRVEWGDATKFRLAKFLVMSDLISSSDIAPSRSLLDFQSIKHITCGRCFSPTDTGGL